MVKFADLTKKAFENYHNTPYEASKWGPTEAWGHIVEFLEHHDSIDDMSGLREALQNMSPKDWETWRTKYPDLRERIIDPLYQEITQQAH
jgi:hypothetical protein